MFICLIAKKYLYLQFKYDLTKVICLKVLNTPGGTLIAYAKGKLRNSYN